MREHPRLRRGHAKANRDFGDFKGLDSLPRRAPPENGKNMRRLTTEGRNAFAPMFPHEMRNKHNPMRRNTAWGGERVKHALEKRNCPAGTSCRETSDASGGCAFQARRMRGFSPSARFASRMGLPLFRPAGAWGRRHSCLRPCGIRFPADVFSPRGVPATKAPRFRARPILQKKNGFQLQSGKRALRARRRRRIRAPAATYSQNARLGAKTSTSSS